jgi:hypothetical protein
MAARGTKHWRGIAVRGFFILGVFTLVTTAAAARQVYLWMTNRQPVAISLAQYMEKRPPGTWLELHDAHLRFDYAIIQSDSKTERPMGLYVPAWTSDDTSEPVQLVVDVTKSRRQEAESKQLPRSFVGTVTGVLRPQMLRACPDPAAVNLPWRKSTDVLELIEGEAPSGKTALIWSAIALGLWAYTAWAIADYRRRDATGQLKDDAP